MKNPLVSNFLNKIKTNKQPYKPKFKVGDYILNSWKGSKIVTQVLEVNLDQPTIHTDEDNFIDIPMKFEAIGEYILLDIINEHSKRGTINKPFFKRYRSIQNIDATYSLVNKDTARILYGKK